MFSSREFEYQLHSSSDEEEPTQEMNDAFKQLLAAQEKAKWAKFNANLRFGVLVKNENDELIPKQSFTHAILDQEAEAFLEPNNPIIQFGASNGFYLQEKKPTYDEVLAYDNSDEADRLLKEKNIPNRKIDL